MIVFGGCSVMNDIKSITLPTILEKQKALMEEKMKEARTHQMEEDSIANASADSTARAEDGDEEEESFEEKEKKVEKALKLPEFSKLWIIRFGYVGLVSAILYAIGGIFLLVKRPFSIKLAYTVLLISILTSGAQAAVLFSRESSGMIALSTGLSQVVGVVADIILIAVIWTSDKEAYQFPDNRTS